MADVLDRQVAAGLSLEALQAQDVLIAGAGSIGSRTGLDLAYAGVGRITWVDPKSLPATAINRSHAKRFIGSGKALAAARHAARTAGSSAVCNAVVATAEEYLEQCAELPTLIISAVDNGDSTRNALDRLCYSQRGAMLHVSIGLDREATQGYVAWSRPRFEDEGHRGCLRCFLDGFPAEEANALEHKDCPAASRVDLSAIAASLGSATALALISGEAPPQLRLFSRGGSVTDVETIAQRPDCECTAASLAARPSTPASNATPHSTEPPNGGWLGPL